jgi:hypothetical protein
VENKNKLSQVRIRKLITITKTKNQLNFSKLFSFSNGKENNRLGTICNEKIILKKQFFLVEI